MIKNTYKTIEQYNKCKDRKYGCSENNIRDIYVNKMEDPCSAIYDGFCLGYVQGRKATLAERKKKELSRATTQTPNEIYRREKVKRRTVPQRVDEFIAKKPNGATLSAVEMDEIFQTGDTFDIIIYAFFYGYIKGVKAKKGRHGR